jgi:hypothetical protein
VKRQLSIIQFPSGRFGFVGSVPKDLAVRKLDGSKLTDSEFERYKNSSNPSMIAKINSYVSPSFASEVETKQFAKLNKVKL